MLKSSLALGPVALVSFACAISVSARAASDPKGIWLNDTGRGAVEIKNCGGALCGHVVWVKDGADAKGCGKQIIGEARPAGGANWGNGWIYSPEKKRRYDVELTPLGEDKLRVVGYAGVKLFSKTMIWKRAPADLQRCGTETVAKSETPKTAPVVPQADVKPAAPAAASVQAPVATPAPEAKTQDVKVADTKAQDVAAPSNKTTVNTSPGDKSPATASPDSGSAKTPATEPSTTAATAPPPPTPPAGKDAAESEEQTDQADNAGDADDSAPSAKKKLNLGDIDVSKFLKKTRSGDCQLDLPWVKIEFGCE